MEMDSKKQSPVLKYNFGLLETSSSYGQSSEDTESSDEAESGSTSATFSTRPTATIPAAASKASKAFDLQTKNAALQTSETPSARSLTGESTSASMSGQLHSVETRPTHSGSSDVPNPTCSSTGRGRDSSTVGSLRGTWTPAGMGKSDSLGTSYLSTRSSSSVPILKRLSTPATGSSSASRSLRTPGSRTPGSRTPGSGLTPHTASSTTSTDHSSLLVAVAEGRGNREVGIAAMDLKRPVLVLSQFTDSETYVKVMTKLNIMQPREILMPHTMCENTRPIKLFQLISNTYHSTINSVNRKYFSEVKGLEYIKQLCLPEFNTVEMEVKSRFYTLACTAALLKYIEFKQNVVYAPSSLKIIFTGSEQTTMIDFRTAFNLELVANSLSPSSQHSLFGILNSTKTAMGARLLKSNILQPPSNVETIKTRLDAVAELTGNEELFYGLQSVLGRFLDVEHLLSLCMQVPKQETVKTAENRINHVIQLKHTLELVEPLQNVLKDSSNTLLQTYYQILSDPGFELLRDKIATVIHEDTKYKKGALNIRTQMCFAIKPNINGMLDVSRRMYSEHVDDIAELVQQLGNEHSLPLKTAYSGGARGFYIQLFCGGKEGLTQDALPSVAVKVTKWKNTLSFTTNDLKKLNDRVKGALQDIYLMSNVVMAELLRGICQHTGCLYKLTECISMLDMLLAFAHNCTLSDYVKPDFTDTLAIKQGVHPILQKIKVEAPVPNNVYAAEECNFLVITGPNMSGKSTYLRQVALLQIMAQIGSFVPAVFASFRIADQIFSRIGTDADMMSNSSTFVVEMKEANYILQNATGTSLIIIDEFGRGTSPDEGTGICWAVCEYLLRLKAFTFIATHFLNLTKLSTVYPNVDNYRFEVRQLFSETGQCDRVQYTHTLSLGKTEEKHYGIQLAEVSTLPREVVSDAMTTAAALDQQKKDNENISMEYQKKKADFRLAQRLIQTARNSPLDSDSTRLKAYLKSLKQQYEMDL